MPIRDQRYLDLQHSAVRAFVGNITANFAAITASWEGNKIRLIAYFFSEPDEIDMDCLDEAETHVVADFGFPATIERHALLVTELEFESVLDFVFLRAEAMPLARGGRKFST